MGSKENYDDFMGHFTNTLQLHNNYNSNGNNKDLLQQQRRPPQQRGRGRAHLLKQNHTEVASPYFACSEVGSRDDGVEGEKKKYMGRGRVCGDPRQPGVKREIKGCFDNSRGDGMGDKVERICDKSAGGEEKVRQRSAMTPMKLAGEEMSDMKGTRGQKIELMSNLIPLRCNTEGIVQYHVTFNPTVEDRLQRIKMLHQHDERLGGTVVFDGMIAFMPKPLPDEVTKLVSKQPSDGAEVTLSVEFVKIPEEKDCLTVFNIIFRKVMSKLNMCQIGRNFFLPLEAKRLPSHDLEVWPGYVTSCGSYECGVLLQMDVSHRVLKTQTALEIMTAIMQSGYKDPSNEIKNALLGKSVLTRYNNKMYKVDDIVWSMTPLDVFTYQGQQISYMEYYKKIYNVDIEDQDQPLLVSVPKNNKKTPKGVETPLICLIPELVYMTGLTDEMRTNFRLMRELANYTKLPPSARSESLLALCHRIKKTPAALMELTKWGFELDTDLYRLEGRVLPMEKITFRNNQVPAGEQADWNRELSRNQVTQSVRVENWLFFVPRMNADLAQKFVEQYRRLSDNMGILVQAPRMVILDNDRTETFLKAIRSGVDEKVQLVVLLFPFQREDRYNAIKRLCCIEKPVPSQVINKRTLTDFRKLRSVTEKISLQINCKLGGTLWGVSIPSQGIMVCGVDVNHGGSKKTRNSIMAFVSSLNPECTKWYSKVKMQEAGEELSSMKVCFIDALKEYYKVNSKMPTRVVIYRDGVGDGQLPVVKDFEVAQLLDSKIDIENQEFRPKLAFIVVQKRINTRFLAVEMNSKLGNPPPGTVVDHSVTKNKWYNFFIVSQHVRQGTVTPTHYVVVHDELGWNADKIQALTYKMTHLYYNWPGTVRVPAPCQYAHKLAMMVGENLKQEPNSKLNNTLFFL